MTRLRIELLGFAALLLGAGFWHLLWPQDFVPAIPEILRGWARPIVIVTGILEIVLGLPVLWCAIWPHHPSFSKLAARALKVSAAYFVGLLWVHIEVSLRAVPVFGIDDTRLLWVRTLLQFPLTLWTYRLSQRVLSQHS